MLARRAVVFAALLAGCNGSDGPSDSEDVVLRVSASHGLDELLPGPEISGGAAYLLPLVYLSREKLVRVLRVEGAEVVLQPRRKSGYSASEIAEALRFRGLESAGADTRGRIRLRFSDPAAAQAFHAWELGAFALGPFEVSDQSDARIRLRAREEDHAIDVIEVIVAEEEQQWRRLLARDVDVVPVTDATRARRLKGIESIRILPIRSRRVYALLLNVREPKLDAPGVRRALGRFIDRRAMARIACGTEACAFESKDSPVAEQETPAAIPDELTVLVLETDDVAASAAEVLRHQLGRRGITIDIDAAPPAEAFARVSRADYELVFVPLTPEPGERLLQRLKSFGFESKELTEAVERGEKSAVREILAREVPFLPLFEARYYAAVDSEFCGGDPESITSWRWLADLYPCESSE